MGGLAIILVKIIDPLSISLALAITSLTFRLGKVSILIAAIVTSLLVETYLSGVSPTRGWGAGLFYGLIASFLQAGLAYLVFSRKVHVAELVYVLLTMSLVVAKIFYCPIGNAC